MRVLASSPGSDLTPLRLVWLALALAGAAMALWQGGIGWREVRATEVVALTNRLGHAPHTCADVVRGATEAVATLQQGAGAPASSPHSDVQLPPPCVQLAGRPARSSAERS